MYQILHAESLTNRIDDKTIRTKWLRMRLYDLWKYTCRDIYALPKEVEIEIFTINGKREKNVQKMIFVSTATHRVPKTIFPSLAYESPLLFSPILHTHKCCKVSRMHCRHRFANVGERREKALIGYSAKGKKNKQTLESNVDGAIRFLIGIVNKLICFHQINGILILAV